MSAAPDRVPLSELLAQALVAFTIEFDNEFEHRMPHRTSTGPAAGSRAGPWLVSQAMWANFMRYVAADGTPMGELRDAARLTNLGGLKRWGYVVVGPDSVVRPTPAGRQAQQIWGPLATEIEGRWRTRFGDEAIDRVRAVLDALIEPRARDLPAYLPVLGHGFHAPILGRPAVSPSNRQGAVAAPDLSALLCKVLIALTQDFDMSGRLSIALDANIMWTMGGEEMRVRDLPRFAGISKEAIAMAIGYLRKRGSIVSSPDPSGRGELVRLTPAGRRVAEHDWTNLEAVEESWKRRHGGDVIAELQASLEQLVGATGTGRSPLFAGLEPYPDGWRAALPRPERLPRYPVVLHRGGFPDGS